MAPAPPRSPVTSEVAGELRRIQERWRVLPLDHATRYAASVRSVAQRLADEDAAARQQPSAPLPDLGPGVVVDQLTVLVYEVSAATHVAGSGHADGGDGGRLDLWLVDLLAGLRRSISPTS